MCHRKKKCSSDKKSKDVSDNQKGVKEHAHQTWFWCEGFGCVKEGKAQR